MKWSMDFDERPHHLFRGGELTHSTLTPSNTCFLRPTWVSLQTASRSMQPFSRTSLQRLQCFSMKRTVSKMPPPLGDRAPI